MNDQRFFFRDRSANSTIRCTASIARSFHQLILASCLVGVFCMVTSAQENESEADEAARASAEAMKKRDDSLAEKLTGTVWRGHFTVDGKLGELKEESYEVTSVKKIAGGVWLFTTRIKYGNKDVKFPVPVKVEWAGDTPVIVVDKMTIPGMGTFDARVVIAEKRYAGSWQHDDVGGHLFGAIEKDAASEESSEEPDPETSSSDD